nr:nucleoporin amo1 [Quercus suber]
MRTSNTVGMCSYAMLTTVQEQGEASLVSGANAKAQYVLNNLDSAVEYVLGGRNTDKDRNQQTKTSSHLGQQSMGHNTGFGIQSAAQNSSSGLVAFGQSSQSSQAGASSFGKTSALGGTGPSAGIPAFGAPSVPGAPNPALGTSGGARPAFGAPSAFGASARAQGSTFGSSSSMGSQPSPFAGGSQTQSQQANGFGSASPFGSTHAQPTAFGSAQTQQSAFGSIGFGQHSQPTGNVGGGFNQVSQPGSGGFGQPSQSGGIGGFGQTSTLGSGGGFGQASQSGPGASPFASKPQQSTSPFGQPGNSIPQSNTGAGFGAPSQLGGGNAFGSQSQPQPPRNIFGSSNSASADPPAHPQLNGLGDSSAITRDSSGKLLKWKGLPVRYDAQGAPLYQDPNTGRTERIWIEKGPPPSHPDFEGPAEAYQGETGHVLKGMYDFLRETNTFKDGLIPEIPPKREWIRWDV